MRILILVDCYLPSTKSSAKLVRDLGVELRRQGNEIIVVAPSESVSQKMAVSTEDGLRVVRVRTGNIKDTRRIFRAFGEAQLSAILWRKAKYFFWQNPCDLIIFYSPTIFLGALVRKLKALWHCPAYLTLRDIFPQWAVDLGLLRKGIVYRFFRSKELQQYAAADVIAVQSPANLEYFFREFPHNNYRLEVLYNWTSLDELGLSPTNYRAQLELKNKVVFFYGGNIGVAQDMDNIVRLAASLTEWPDICFLLVGDGSEVPRLKAFIAAQNLQNIRMLPAVGQQEYLSMLSEFDVGLISLDRRLKTQNMPGKLLAYMYCRKPVLASINPGNDLANLIEQGQAGLCCLNGDDVRLRAAALRLADDPELRTEMGKNSRRLLEQTFSVRSAAHQILAHLRKAHCFSSKLGANRAVSSSLCKASPEQSSAPSPAAVNASAIPVREA